MLKNKKHIFCLGIGGIGLSALARHFISTGMEVYGYDRKKTTITQSLESDGALIIYQDNPNKISNHLKKENTLVIYSAAIPKENRLFAHFKANQYSCQKRAKVLGRITEDTFCFAVAGTHGKTTTSTILSHLLKESGESITAFLGGISENYQSNYIQGNGKISVVEADEYDRSFLQLSPNIACVTSTDADHLDIYKNSQELKNAYSQFLSQADSSGHVISHEKTNLGGITYSIEGQGDYQAKGVRIVDGIYEFEALTPKKERQLFQLKTPGRHNIENSLAAIAMAHEFGISLDKLSMALKTFKGIKRRTSIEVKSKNKIYIDDYAHHPTEIRSILNTLRELYPNQYLLAVFQPHLYSRTRDFVDGFAQTLSEFDGLFLLDIYPAREQPIKGVTSDWLFDKIKLEDKNRMKTEEVVENLKQTRFDVLLTIGAGNIDVLVGPIKKWLSQ